MAHLTKSTKTPSAKEVERTWHHIDVKGKTLGRIANVIAQHLQGKNKTNYAPNIDVGDYVVVTNAKKVTLSGKKAQEKEYAYFSGYPGGLRKVSFESMLEHNPKELIRHAVSGMLPKNKLRDRRLARLFVFPDEKHNLENKFSNSQS